MPFFPLAGGEIAFLVLGIAIAQWVARAWWRGEIDDELLPPRLRRAKRTPKPPPRLRVIRGGRYGATDSPPAGTPSRRRSAPTVSSSSSSSQPEA